MKIGIVGGSIAGCSAAFLLLKEGHDVSVYERSRHALVGRGGGIGTTPGLMEQILNAGLISDNFSYFQINKMPFVGKNNLAEPFGKTAWAMPINFHVFQWNELWRNLRAHVPNERYHAGIRMIGAKTIQKNKVELTFSTGDTEQFDLVIFADGYRSLGRSILFPDKELKYRGYVLWRGLLPESKTDEKSPLNDEILRLSYAGNPGHNVVYFIPDNKGSVRKGERIFNWASYITLSEDELTNVMTDKAGKVREGTLPPGRMRKEIEKQLKHFISQNIPSYYADIVNKTKNSYIQVIYTLDLDQFYKDNMCLIGDAGMVIQPFTGSGVFKGFNNVVDLIESLKENKALPVALDIWSQKQIVSGKKLLELGEQMEKAYIWNQLDFAHSTEEETKAWWNSSVTFPENFNYK